MFNWLSTHLRSWKGLDVPATYDPKLHYNCFVETVRQADRQAVYRELRRRGLIRASHLLPDGRLQLAVRKLSKAIAAYNAVANEKVFAAGLTKARIAELQDTNPDMEVTVLEKMETGVLHANKIALRQIGFASDKAFCRGVECQERRRYQKAIECYDEAVRIEPEDVRAWYNKVIVLAEDNKHQAALEVANDVLGRHANIGILWEAKGLVLGEMGQVNEAEECMSIACQLNRVIAKRHTAGLERARWRLAALRAACREAGKDPETDVDFWFARSMEFAGSEDAQGALMCLQMAARNGPDHFVVHDESGMALLPPGHLLLSKELLPEGARVERLRDLVRTLTPGSKTT